MEHICKFCGKEFDSGIKLGGHTGRCKGNPNIEQTVKRLSDSAKRKLSDFHKSQIGKGMKEAHKSGRAWNIGRSRWNNEPSYPEKFFTRVIENEFLDKEYKREFAIGIFSIDFAWPNKKKAIEIDGKQHEYPEQKERDGRKDQLLHENGWEILRIKWVDLFNDTRNKINEAYNFIHNASMAQLVE